MRLRAYARTESQAAELMRRGFDTVYREHQGESLEDFLRTLKPGVVYGVSSLDQLADPKIKQARLRRRAFWQAMRRVCAVGAIIQDRKGRRTDRDKIEMTEEAIEEITSKGRGRHSARNGKKGGRPREFTDAELEPFKTIWNSRKYGTAQSAVDRMGAGWTVRKAYRLLGPRG